MLQNTALLKQKGDPILFRVFQTHKTNIDFWNLHDKNRLDTSVETFYLYSHAYDFQGLIYKIRAATGISQKGTLLKNWAPKTSASPIQTHS